MRSASFDTRCPFDGECRGEAFTGTLALREAGEIAQMAVIMQKLVAEGPPVIQILPNQAL
jgi:hypothetical protein